MIFLFGSLFVCSCTQKIYIRYSNLHHATQNQIIEFNNDSLFCIIQSKDTIIYKEKGLKSDYISSGKFKMLERKRVIMYDGSFFIKKGVRSKKILSKYTNKDLNF